MMGRDGQLRWLHLELEILRFHPRMDTLGENTGRKRYSAQDSQGMSKMPTVRKFTTGMHLV